jgi:hypothetical protein
MRSWLSTSLRKGSRTVATACRMFVDPPRRDIQHFESIHAGVCEFLVS